MLISLDYIVLEKIKKFIVNRVRFSKKYFKVIFTNRNFSTFLRDVLVTTKEKVSKSKKQKL